MPISRAFVADIEVRSSGDGRTISGVVVPFGRVAMVSDGGAPYAEMFERGAFAETIKQRGHKVKLLSQHQSRMNPLGRATMLREDEAGLFGEFHVSKTAAGDEALELVRDGAIDSFSVGFAPIRHEKRDKVTVRTEVAMREASLVTFPAYEDARIQAVRMWEALSEDERHDWARMVAEFIELRSTTPDEGPEAADTPAGAVAVGKEPAEGHSARVVMSNFQHLRKIAREKGVL